MTGMGGQYHRNIQLTSQTTIFSVIITFIILILGYVNYAQLKKQLKTVKKKYERSIENYQKMNKILDLTNSDLYGTITIISLNGNLMGNVIDYGLKSLTFCNIENTERTLLLNNANQIKKWLDADFTEKDIKRLHKKKDKIFEYLNTITKIDDKEFQIIIAEIRISFNQKLTIPNNAYYISWRTSRKLIRLWQII